MILRKWLNIFVSNEPFHGLFCFSTFDRDQSAKIHPNGWKKTPQHQRSCHVWKWFLKTNEDIDPQKVEKLQTFGREGWGRGTWPKFVKKQKYFRGGVERGPLNLPLHSTCKVIYQAFTYVHSLYTDLILTVCWLKYEKAIRRTVA